MLSFKEKIQIYESMLLLEEVSYADSFNGEILLYSQNFDFSFLNIFHSKLEMEVWIRKLKSRIVLKEDEDLVEEIIDDYVLWSTTNYLKKVD